MVGVDEAGGGRGELSGSYQAQAQQPRRQSQCLSKPVVCRVLGQPVKLNARVASRSGALGAWDWTNGRPEQSMVCKILFAFVTVAAQCSQASPRALGPSISEPPLWMRALSLPLSLPASTSDCSSLSVSLSLSMTSGRNPVQKLNAHLTAAYPHPLGGARQRAQRSRPKSGQASSKPSLPRFESERGRGYEETTGRWQGAASTRASDGMRSRSYCTRCGVGG